MLQKRLMDYGFHAPTVSFPVAGTLMIFDLQNQNLKELDRFAEALIAIKAEKEIAEGKADAHNNVLKKKSNPYRTSSDFPDLGTSPVLVKSSLSARMGGKNISSSLNVSR